MLEVPLDASRRDGFNAFIREFKSPVRKVERQIASGKGPDTIAGSNTYKALCAVCKKWGLPTGTIAQKADMATALVVEQWKKMTAAA